MAFQTIDQWQVERSFGWRFNPTWLPAWPDGWPYRDRLHKFFSGSFAILFHGLFFYFLITAAFNKAFEKEPAVSAGETTSMTMLELGEVSKDDQAMETETGSEPAPSQVTQSVPSDIEVATQTELPPEWSLSRIKVPRLVSNISAPEPPAAPNAGAGAGQGAASGGEKGGVVYDPFAGAAPNRKPEFEDKQLGPAKEPSLAGRVAGFFGFGDDANGAQEDAFEQWVAGLRARLPRAKGSVELSVTLGNDGKVKAGEVLGGSASPQVKFFVRNAAIGQNFAGLETNGAGGVKLPVIQLN
ncbi:MAG: hypothetical protein ABJP02_17680 [Parasphingorhabdus sp.]|uniref:hypothetical protein n=1 Tax=Parasphingorhabdus sp. TaxID=2709688 RepID=UPI0032983484